MGAKVNNLVCTDNQTSGIEPKYKKSTTDVDQKRQNLHRFNSLLDPNLAVYDLDTININPKMFDYNTT